MNRIKILFAPLIFTTVFFQTAVSIAAEPEPGFITFYVGGKEVCRVKIEAGQTNLFTKEKGCRTGTEYEEGAIKLESVRSATTIKLSANRNLDPVTPAGCNNTNGFEYIIRTTKNDVSTDIVANATIREGTVGMPLLPGVKLMKVYQYGGVPPRYPTTRCLNISFD